MKTNGRPYLLQRIDLGIRAGLCVALALLVGCSDPGPKGPERVQTVHVTGKVLVDGKTVELPKQVAIKAFVQGSASPTATEPAAYANPDGTFNFSTYEAGDGVPVGEYKLTFQLGQRNLMRARFEGDEFKGKYSDPEKSEYSLAVLGTETEPIDLGTIELTLK